MLIVYPKKTVRRPLRLCTQWRHPATWWDSEDTRWPIRIARSNSPSWVPGHRNIKGNKRIDWLSRSYFWQSPPGDSLRPAGGCQRPNIRALLNSRWLQMAKAHHLRQRKFGSPMTRPDRRSFLAKRVQMRIRLCRSAWSTEHAPRHAVQMALSKLQRGGRNISFLVVYGWTKVHRKLFTGDEHKVFTSEASSFRYSDLSKYINIIWVQKEVCWATKFNFL